ncbi:ABC transporter substrate-binding protein [candidate division KSB1 bacterium]
MKLGRGILALVLVGFILLLSDISNWQRKATAVTDIFNIVLVNWVDSPVIEKIEKGIKRGLKDRGLIEERNLKITTYKASGDISMLNSIFNQVRSLQPNLIFVSCTPALQSAVKNIKEIPVVFTAVADPVLAGAGTDAKHHLPNITGCSVDCDFNTMCRLIKENAPKKKTLGSIYCPGEVISVKFKYEFSRIASEYDLEVKFFPANNTTELPDAVLSMCNSNIDAVCQMGDNLMASGISTLIKGVVDADIPYFDFNRRPDGTSMESLIQIDLNYFENGYDAAIYAAEILLEKKNPSDLPFKPLRKSILEINPVKAKKYGIEFNEAAKQKADLIIGEK